MRFEFAPINTGYATNGCYTEDIFNFYSERSGKGIDIVYIGNVVPKLTYATNKNTATLCDNNLKNLKKLYSIIINNNSTPAIQLGFYKSKIIPIKNNKEKYQPLLENIQTEFSSISNKTIDDILCIVIKSIIKLYDIGYRVIQIHAAHGYFFSCFFNRLINKRHDNYALGRLEWLKDFCQHIKQIMPNIMLDIRLNIRDYIENCESYKYDIICNIINCGFDKISFSNGFYNIDKTHIYPNNIDVGLESLLFARDVASIFSDKLFSVSGNIIRCLDRTQTFPENLIFSLGRPIIADPYAVVNFNNSIIKCNLCGNCHYYSQGRKTISCCLWK